jgi:hypothetical protein
MVGRHGHRSRNDRSTPNAAADPEDAAEDGRPIDIPRAQTGCRRAAADEDRESQRQELGGEGVGGVRGTLMYPFGRWALHPKCDACHSEGPLRTCSASGRDLGGQPRQCLPPAELVVGRQHAAGQPRVDGSEQRRGPAGPRPSRSGAARYAGSRTGGGGSSGAAGVARDRPGQRPSAATHEPARMRISPRIAPSVSGSPSSVTP